MTNPDQNEVTTGASNTDAKELDRLKEQADSLGMKYNVNIGKEKLLANLKAFQDKPPVFTKITPVKETPTPQQLKMKVVKDATRLVRVRVTCMNPNKKEWEGEVFTASNSVVPTQKKFVPFNAEDGWHVPQIIVNVMAERKCQIFKSVKGPKGEKIRKGFPQPEFNIEYMDALSESEMKELATQQAMANNLD
jgi:hypothetical protein